MALPFPWAQPARVPPPLNVPQVGVPSRSRPRLALPPGVMVSWLGGGILVVTAAVSLYLIQVSTVATAGYEFRRLEAERAGWQARNEQLSLELDKRRSLVWTETQAAQELKMGPAERVVQIIVTERAPNPCTTSDGDCREANRPLTNRTSARPRPDLSGIAGGIDVVRSWIGSLPLPGSR